MHGTTFEPVSCKMDSIAYKKLKEDLSTLKFLQSFITYKSDAPKCRAQANSDEETKEFANYFFNGATDPDRQRCLATCFRRAQEVNFIIRYLRTQFTALDPDQYLQENVEKSLLKWEFERKCEHDPESKSQKNFKIFKLQHAYETVDKLYDDLEIKLKYGIVGSDPYDLPYHPVCHFERDCNLFMIDKDNILKDIGEMLDWYQCALQNLLDTFEDLEATLV